MQEVPADEDDLHSDAGTGQMGLDMWYGKQLLDHQLPVGPENIQGHFKLSVIVKGFYDQ
jgi:hypothetical protein